MKHSQLLKHERKSGLEEVFDIEYYFKGEKSCNLYVISSNENILEVLDKQIEGLVKYKQTISVRLKDNFTNQNEEKCIVFVSDLDGNYSDSILIEIKYK